MILHCTTKRLVCIDMSVESDIFISSYSACTFAVAFPLFIVSANDAKPEESTYVCSIYAVYG